MICHGCGHDYSVERLVIVNGRVYCIECSIMYVIDGLVNLNTKLKEIEQELARLAYKLKRDSDDREG